MIEFFDVLKNENAIWQTKSEKFKDKVEKQKSWEKLVTKWKEVDKNATVDVVKKKYNCLRTTYRRELQKMRKSERSGAGAEDIYVPSLWYFDHLNFLLDQETQLEGISTFVETFDAEIEKVSKLCIFNRIFICVCNLLFSVFKCIIFSFLGTKEKKIRSDRFSRNGCRSSEKNWPKNK